MKLVSFVRPGGQPEAGMVHGDQVVPLAGAGFPDMLSVIAGGDVALERIRAVSAPAAPLGSVTLLAPIPRPPKVICVGLNYRDHALESKMEIPAAPTIFCKFPTAVAGPDQPIVLPRGVTRPDYEAELAFVVGRGGRYIPASEGLGCVFGYLNANDVSARDVQFATTQWIMGKTYDTFCPMGPWLVTADEIPDPHDLDISLTVNGEAMQSSNTRHLIFRIPELVAHLSSVFTLEPGDVVLTGTPSGVGFARNPPRYLAPGDEVVVCVAGLGELRNPVVAEG